MKKFTVQTISAVLLIQSEIVRAGKNGGSTDDGTFKQCGQGSSPSELFYFCGPTYEAQTASVKLQQLWDQCLVGKDEAVLPVPFEHLPDMFNGKVGKSFSTESDELPKDRHKIVHATGVVGQVRWVPEPGHPYTGIFASESTALLRMSEANFDLREAPGLTPSLALKFTRDGVRSVNLLANVSFEPTESHNFFANDFRVNIPTFQDQCAIDTIQQAFLQNNSWINNLGLAELARMTQAGLPSKLQNDDIDFPFDLWLEYAGPDLATLWPNWTDHSERQQNDDGSFVKFYDQLKEIGQKIQDDPNSSTLFNVMARQEPLDHKPQKIAEVRLETELITSPFGDQRLFFKHEKKKDDFDVEGSCAFPKLNQTDGFIDTFNKLGEWPTDNVQAEAWMRGSLKEYQCPFAWLLNNAINPILSI